MRLIRKRSTKALAQLGCLHPAEVGSGVCARAIFRLCRVQGLIGAFTAGSVIDQEQSSTPALTKSHGCIVGAPNRRQI